jgi:plasmid stabilization system protein ParE
MTIRFSPVALGDLEGIRAYLLARSPQGAERVRQAIADAIERCALDPRIGSKTDEPGLFRRPLRKYRYTIFDRSLPDGEGIEIARIVHSARVKTLGTLPGPK